MLTVLLILAIMATVFIVPALLRRESNFPDWHDEETCPLCCLLGVPTDANGAYTWPYKDENGAQV